MIDRITILNIKAREMVGDASVQSFAHSQQLSLEFQVTAGLEPADLPEYHELTSINLELWHVEDSLREVLQTPRADWTDELRERFIDLAIRVPRLNDRRGRVKQAIDRILKSQFPEHKKYAEWEQ